MKAVIYFTMDTLTTVFIAFVAGLGTAFISYGMDGPAWLTDAIGWTVFGGTAVRLWTWLRSLH